MENISNQIAIIGMQGRFPGAANVEEFWRNLCNGVETVSAFSDQEMLEAGVDPELLAHPDFVRAAGVLDNPEYFDAHFFGYSPREAEIIDPQQRLFLECAWEVIEQAGYALDTYEGSIGVFASSNVNSYLLPLINSRFVQDMGISPFQILLSNDKDYLPTRVSYKLNLKGPSMNVQTACSSSLVAIHQACQSLLNHECDMALAGGVSLHFPQKTGYLYQEGAIGSPDGHCRAFDAQSKGTVEGYGLGVVLLKRLEDALADRDSLYAVVLSSAINNDGATKIGFTAPSVQGQAEVIAEALALAEVDPETIGYVEAHGTGTPLGDPIEIAALTQAYGDKTSATEYCALGSVKTNVGHLNTAAGVTGFIKAALALKHRQIPASLHFTTPNPNIDFAHSPFYINARLTEWQSKDHPCRAGVSSFGVGGTNAHVILQEAPEVMLEPERPTRPWHLLPLSAKKTTILENMTQNLKDYLKQHSHQKLYDVAYTLQVGRNAFEHRRFAVVRDQADDAIQVLETQDPTRVRTRSLPAHKARIAFLFPGQGSQYVNMGKELYQYEQVFRYHLDRCAELLKPHLKLDLRTVIYPEAEHVRASQELLSQTWLTQPALFSVEYALAQLWISWGVKPQVMLGHSIGEYVAACLAGIFSLQDALALVAARGRLIQQLPGGAMLSVSLPAAEVELLLDDSLALAASNSSSLCVVSGPLNAVEQLQQHLEARTISCRRLHTSHAFHSPMLDAILEPFAQEFKRRRLSRPKLPFISNLTGTWIREEEATDLMYWVQHLRSTVRFDEGLQVLFENQQNVLLEVGPGHTLSVLARQCQGRGAQQTILSSLPHPNEQLSDYAVLLSALGKLWLEGGSIDWAGMYEQGQQRRIPLPTYSFERARYWIETGSVQEERTHHLTDRQTSEQATTVELDLHEKPFVQNSYEKAQDSVESQLVDLWQMMLGIEHIGIMDNFFELGGHSLLATQIMARVDTLFHVRLPLQSIFEAPTIRQFAQLIKAKQPDVARKGAANQSSPWLDDISLSQLIADVQLLSQEQAHQYVVDEKKAWSFAPSLHTGARTINEMSPEQKDLLLLRLCKRLEQRQRPDSLPLIRRETATTYHPLSFFQQRYWVLNSLDPLNTLSVYRLCGQLDIAALIQSLHEIIKRHEILRTGFVVVDNQPYQCVHTPDLLQLPCIDICAVSCDEREAHARQLVSAFNAIPIDLAGDLLLRALLIRCDDHEYVLAVVIHHIAFDGWSQRNLEQEIAILYNAYLHGLPSPLAPLPVQYKDFAYWQHECMQKGLFDDQLLYWTRQLRGWTPLALPQDRPAPPVRTFAGAQETFQLTEDLTDALISLGQQEGASLFTTLLTSFMVVLSQVTAQQDIVVGTPFANRHSTDVEGLIGLFINTLLLRTSILEELTFRQCLHRVKEIVSEAYAHQDLPFIKVVEALQHERGLEHDPGIVQILFALQNFPVSPVEMEGLTLEPFDMDAVEVRHDLQLYMLGNSADLVGVLQYKTDLFSATTIQRMVNQYQHLLRAVVANPDQSLVALLSEVDETSPERACSEKGGKILSSY